MCSTSLIKFAIAGCLHSKFRGGENGRLLQDDRSDAPEDIKLDCKYYKPGKFFNDRSIGIRINIPKATQVNKNKNTYVYSNELPLLVITTHRTTFYHFEECINNLHKIRNHEGLIKHLTLLNLTTEEGKRIDGTLAIYTNYQNSISILLSAK